VRVRVNGEIRSLDEEIELDKNRKHSLELVVDRLTIKREVQVLAEQRVPGVRRGVPRVAAAPVQLQQSVRRLSRLLRSRRDDGIRS
jgi:excinuclease UvrABC ATPase subunit